MNQDNPFATGVSINQDIVMEETPIKQGRICDYDISKLPKEIQCMPVSGPAFRALHQARINHRSLLALGREEE